MDQLIMGNFSMLQENAEEPNWLPPGFRFHPTDDELIDYLKRKVFNPNFRVRAIQQVDLKKSEPWELPGKSKMGEKEWYFFTLRDRKYPTGMRTNRATEAGYWKGTGKDREVFSARSNIFVGMKKTLVFYKGRAPKGEKTNWIMHEYRLEGASASLNLQNSRSVSQDSEWVVCRIFHKMPGGKKAVLKHFLKANHCMQQNQLADQLFLPPLHEWPLPSLATDDPELDSDDHSGLQVSSFTTEHAALPLSTIANHNSDHWIEGGKSSGAAVNSAFLETTASSAFGFTTGVLTYNTPYLDLPGLSNTVPKIKREQVLHSSALSTNFMEENESLQGGGQKIMDNNIWLEGGVDYECSDQPLLNLSCIPIESPLLEISEEVSPIIYKNGLSSPEDLSCFWNY